MGLGVRVCTTDMQVLKCRDSSSLGMHTHTHTHIYSSYILQTEQHEPEG